MEKLPQTGHGSVQSESLHVEHTNHYYDHTQAKAGEVLAIVETADQSGLKVAGDNHVRFFFYFSGQKFRLLTTTTFRLFLYPSQPTTRMTLLIGHSPRNI